MLNDIEESLTQSEIEPGEEAKATRRIEGSQFVSYRNDKSAEGQYTQTAFNDSGEKDQLQEIIISTHYSLNPK